MKPAPACQGTGTYTECLLKRDKSGAIPHHMPKEGGPALLCQAFNSGLADPQVPSIVVCGSWMNRHPNPRRTRGWRVGNETGAPVAWHSASRRRRPATATEKCHSNRTWMGVFGVWFDTPGAIVWEWGAGTAYCGFCIAFVHGPGTYCTWRLVPARAGRYRHCRGLRFSQQRIRIVRVGLVFGWSLSPSLLQCNSNRKNDQYDSHTEVEDLPFNCSCNGENPSHGDEKKCTTRMAASADRSP